MTARLPTLAAIAPVPGGRDGDRSVGPGPRAFDARGFGTFHHLLVQIADATHRPRFAEACRAFGDLAWCSDLDDLALRAMAPEATAVVVDLTDGHGVPTHPVVARVREARPDFPIVLWCDRAAVRGGGAGAG